MQWQIMWKTPVLITDTTALTAYRTTVTLRFARSVTTSGKVLKCRTRVLALPVATKILGPSVSWYARRCKDTAVLLAAVSSPHTPPLIKKHP